MEPEGSLPCSQEPSTGLYPQLDQCSPYHPILSLFKIHLNIILPLRLFLLSYLLPSGFPTKILYVSVFSHMRAACPSHLTLLDLIILIILGEETETIN
jgi:hypothetical protein